MFTRHVPVARGRPALSRPFQTALCVPGSCAWLVTSRRTSWADRLKRFKLTSPWAPARYVRVVVGLNGFGLSHYGGIGAIAPGISQRAQRERTRTRSVRVAAIRGQSILVAHVHATGVLGENGASAKLALEPRSSSRQNASRSHVDGRSLQASAATTTGTRNVLPHRPVRRRFSVWPCPVPSGVTAAGR